MLKRRAVHKDMAEANVYAARRLKDMAQSLGGLAKTFGRCREEPGLSREDGIAALEAASAMVCGECESCGIRRECRRGGDDENYYLYYLLRTFEKKGCVEYEDMPRRFLEVCRRKSDYLGQLNRNLGRATMNLTWKNRFLESRAAVMTQFEELAGILEEFSGQMEQALDVTMTWEGELKTALRKRRIDVESLLVLQYGQGRREVFMTARMTNGRCMTARDASEAIAQGHEGQLQRRRDGKAIITRNPASFRFIEDGRYRILFGSSRVPRDGEEVSGDSYTFKSGLPGQAILSLSDGMGSGQAASEDSEKVMELTEPASGHGLFSQVGPEAGEHGASADRAERPSGDSGPLPGGSLFRSGRGHEAGSRGLFYYGPGRCGGAGVGACARRSHESRGAGDDLKEALGRGPDRHGQRRHPGRHAGGGKGSGVFGFPCRSAGGRAPGDSGDDHGLCPVL